MIESLVSEKQLADLKMLLDKAQKIVLTCHVSPDGDAMGALTALLSVLKHQNKEVFAIMAETGENPEKIVEEKGLKQVTDTSAIEAVIDEVLAAAPENVAAYKGGKQGLFGWFVGQVMKASKGKANPVIVNQMLKDKLG